MKPSIYLNVGLISNKATGMHTIAFDAVSCRLTQLGFRRQTARIEQSATEPTFVWRGDSPGMNACEVVQALYFLAVEFHQDAVAVVIDTPELQLGALVGPAAQQWGAFDASQFIK